MKSYGRAPTFLLRTGYEQVRSIVAALAGDLKAANRIELVLPETGVCSLDRDRGSGDACCDGKPDTDARTCATKTTGKHGDAAGAETISAQVAGVETGCCGGAPKTDATACCLKDEDAKAAGESGCGCGSESSEPAKSVANSCCG
jgi:hypothetical protein